VERLHESILAGSDYPRQIGSIPKMMESSRPSTRKPRVQGAPGSDDAGDGRRAADDFGRECEEVVGDLGKSLPQMNAD